MKRRETLQAALSGERLAEFETCRDILLEDGQRELSVQKVLSAAMQIMIGFKQMGGILTYSFHDGRTKED